MTGQRVALRWTAVACLLALGIAILVTWDHDGLASDAAPPLAATSPGVSVAAEAPPGTPSADPASSAPTSPRPASSEHSATSSPPGPVATDAGPPLPPDAATGLTVAAADAVVRFYYAEAENYLKASGDGSAVSRSSDPGCVPCRQTVAYFAARNAANRLLTGDYWWRAVDVREVRMTGATSAVVDVNVRTGRHKVVLRRGAAATAYPGGTAYLAVTLLARGGHWVIFDVEAR